jgi:serine protease Do
MDGIGTIGESLRRSTVQVLRRSRRSAGGSGVIWRSDGLILTNAHVVGSSAVKVELWDGRTFSADTIARDDRRDLAALRIQAADLPAATAADSETVRAGEMVVAVGNPLGFVGALTTGVVHAVGPLRGAGRQNWVQADIRLAPGNSGGPLANASGRVIGINTMIVAGGLALAVPSNTIQRFVEHGASSVSLGVVVRPVSITANETPSLGLLVLEVDANGAAARASILMGDLLVGVNGKPFKAVDDLGDALDDAAGRTIQLLFVRGDRRTSREVTVRLEASRAEAA